MNKLNMHYIDIVTTYTPSITTACILSKEVYEVMIKFFSSVQRILHLQEHHLLTGSVGSAAAQSVLTVIPLFFQVRWPIIMECQNCWA